MRYSLPFCLLCLLLSSACELTSSSVKEASAEELMPVVEIVETSSQQTSEAPELSKEQTAILPFEGSFQLIGVDGLTFTVQLSQKGDSIWGSYCGYTENRSDCGMPSQGAPDCKIRGLVKSRTAQIVFTSCYMGTEGEAEIRLSDRDLIWNTTKYPAKKEGIYFCAAPDSALLFNERLIFDGTVELPEFELRSANWLSELPEGPEKRLFRTTKILHDHAAKDFKHSLRAGTPFRILEEAGTYVFARIGDEIFEVPAFLIAYEYEGQQMKGYIHFEDIAYHYIEDNVGNLIMLGLEEEEIVIKVVNPLGDIKTFQTQHKPLQEHASAYFPLAKYRIQSFPHLQMEGFSFFKLSLSIDKNPTGMNVEQLYAWDGKDLVSLIDFDPYNRPVDIQAKLVGELLQLSFWLDGEKDAAKGIEKRKAYFSFDPELGFEVGPVPHSNIALAYKGDQNEFTFPNPYELLDWSGVYLDKEEIKIEKLEIELQKEEAENELVGKWIKKFITSRPDKPYDFLIHGLPEQNLDLPLVSGSFEEGELDPGGEKRIIFSNSNWYFKAKGKKDSYGSAHYSLFLGGKKGDSQIEQKLYVSAIRDMPVEFLWAGDLDGDGKVDFILNLSEKGLTTDSRLYLSSFAREGELVGWAGSFPSNMPGC